MKFTDSHCHLDFDEFKPDFQQLLTNCAAQGIHRCVIPSIDPNNWQAVLHLTQEKNISIKLFAALGIHPWFLNDLSEQVLEQLTTIVQQQKHNIVAIGEAGIDGKIAEQQNNLAKQQHFFEYQLHLAKQEDLPIIVHHRRSHQHITPLLKQYSLANTGIIHAFSGSYQQAKQYIDLGYKLGIGGTITYPRAQKTIKAIKRLPLTSLVLETDAPAMPLNGFQGEVNTPLQIIKVFNTLVAIRTEATDKIAEQIEININDVLKLKVKK
ncbi:MAG: hydrolase TatD [Gammaproteobacteria bacterium]|nr:MAG: hydrolase TatD [Gammaproteobacteria bacterium]